MARLVAKIAVSAATYWLDKPYDYLIPEELETRAVPGVRVHVPFSRGNRRTEGVLLAVSEESAVERPLKAILAVLDDAPVLTPEQIKLALFMRERFFCTVYDAVRAMLPAGLWFDEEGRRRAQDKTQEMARLLISPEDASAAAQARRLRSPAQAAILEQLCAFEAIPSRDLLLHAGGGPPGAQGAGKGGACGAVSAGDLSPPQIHVGETEPLPVLVGGTAKAFEGSTSCAESGESGAALLFGVTGSGKTSVYIHLIDRQLRRGKSVILLVPEIALTPQMIQTFSSHFGNEVAVLHSSLSIGERYDEWKRIKGGKAHVVIGTRSAVFAPCEDLGLLIIDEEQEETYKSENIPRYNARDVAKYRCAQSGCLLLLGSATPDMVSMYRRQTGRYLILRCRTAITSRSLPGRDRGYEAGAAARKRRQHQLLPAHGAGSEPPPRRAEHPLHQPPRRPQAGQLRGLRLYLQVPALQRLADLSQRLRPADLPLLRLFQASGRGLPQMVTKGLNFENVTLVGVISADQSLYAGDYRAGERTFSLITQVVGRSGRGSKAGRAVIQTFTPDNETILQAAKQDYEAFYRSEIELRKLQNTPPFSELLSITVSGLNEEHVYRACRSIRQRLDGLIGDSGKAQILGPAPLAVVKVNNRYRYRVMIFGRMNAGLRATVAGVVMECCSDKRFADVSIYADNDPNE